MKQDNGRYPYLVSGVMKSIPNKLIFLLIMNEELEQMSRESRRVFKCRGKNHKVFDVG